MALFATLEDFSAHDPLLFARNDLIVDLFVPPPQQTRKAGRYLRHTHRQSSRHPHFCDIDRFDHHRHGVPFTSFQRLFFPTELGHKGTFAHKPGV